MSDFPSINNLLNKDEEDNKNTKGPGEVQAKFSKRMKQIASLESEKQTASAAASLGLKYIDLTSFPVSSEALKIIPLQTAQEKQVICFFTSPEELKLGIIKPTEEINELTYQLGEKHHATPDLYLISNNSFERVIKLYNNLPIVKPVSKDINITQEEVDKFQVSVNNLESLKKQFENVSISDILTLILASALKVNASDVHVEAEENGVAVRYRIDGVLHEVSSLPKEQWKKFVSRIKLLAGLKININDKPQDGRVTISLGEKSIDVRVSTMPTVYGESVVMRILYSGTQGVTFDELGLSGDAYERLKHEVGRPNGMIITTGPTGSGKTTTMYAILRTLNKPGVKIITLEDPVEIKMEGVNQSQVDESRNYTFAKGLRSLLRQDPDICMVGEIRDLETAEIAIQAALTGHLMLSTIHTNSAAGAIPRFLSMGVKPFLLAPALNAVIGQRLARRICEKCTEETQLTAEMLQRVKEILNKLPEKEKSKINLNDLHFYHGKGCEACSGLGYKGRIGIYEIFTMNKEIEKNILSGQISEYTIEEIALKNGMITMAQDGLLKALQKLTTVDEIFRVAE